MQIKSKAKGFSLVELITTVAVSSVLLGVAAPSFVSVTTQNRITTYTNGFVASLNLARAEAIRRRTTVSVCATADGVNCTSSSGKWSQGWIIFVNTDNDSPAAIDVAEQSLVLKKFSALTSGYSLGSSDFSSHVTFNPDGSVITGGEFAICHNNSITGARAVVLTRMRPRLASDTDKDNIPNIDSGNISSCSP